MNEEFYMDLPAIEIPAKVMITPQLVVVDGDFQVDVTRLGMYIQDAEGNMVEVASCISLPEGILDSVVTPPV